MLTWIAVALAIGVVVTVGHWLLHRYDSLGRRRAFPTVLVVVLAVPAVVAATPGVQRWRTERTLEAAVERVVGFPVDVRCQTFGGAFVDAGAELGYVAWGPDGIPERRTLIKYEQCDHLGDFLGSDKVNPPLEQVIAVHILSHEAMHMAGIKVESKAECAAVQRDAAMARALGASPVDAVALARTYYAVAYPTLPEAYVDGSCRAGGSLDEGLPDPPWPPS